MKNIFLKVIFICLITSGCGFKVANRSEKVNFSINEINSTGDKIINYKIKNNLIFQFDSKKGRTINLEINSKKNKSVKEKNIKNEITKYQIDINVNVAVKDVTLKNIDSFNITENGHFSVSSRHSDTLNNEKKLVDLLAESLVDKIIDELTLIINDI